MKIEELRLIQKELGLVQKVISRELLDENYDMGEGVVGTLVRLHQEGGNYIDYAAEKTLKDCLLKGGIKGRRFRRYLKTGGYYEYIVKDLTEKRGIAVFTYNPGGGGPLVNDLVFHYNDFLINNNYKKD